MAIYDTLPDAIDEVDVIIAGGEFVFPFSLLHLFRFVSDKTQF